MADQELIIKISGDPSEYKAAVQQASDATDDLKQGLSALAEIVAFAELSRKIYDTIDAYHDQQKAIAAVSEALQNQGLAGQGLAQQYVETAEAIEKKTGMDAAQIITAQASAQALLGQKAITSDLTKAVVDFAASQRIGVAEAFTLVARAAQNGTEILKRHGLVIQDAGTSSQRLADITAALKQQFGGSAEAMAGVSGSTDVLRGAFNELEKKLGEKLAPTFDKIVASLTSLFSYLSEHDELVSLAADVSEAALALGGIIAVAVGVQQAFALMSAAAAAFGVTLNLATGGIALALGLVVVAIVDLYNNWNERVERMKDIWRGFLVTLSESAAAVEKFFSALFHFDAPRMRSAANDMAVAFKDGWEEATKKIDIKAPVIDEKPQNEAKAKAAKTRADTQAFYDNLELERKKAQIELLAFEDAGATKDTIDLKKQEIQILTEMENQKNAAILGILKERLDKVRGLQTEQYAVQREQDEAFEQEILAHNEAFQQMSAEQQRAFMDKNKAQLEAQLTTRRTQLATAAKAEADIQIKAHNQFLLDQQKFGVAYATINMAMHSAIYEGSKTAFGNLEQLTQSHNETLKSIGRVAAIANIVMKTAQAAMDIYAGFSTIPIIGPALGIAGAAAAIAFGAEQVSRVQGAAQGAVVEGGIPGVDSVPFMLQQGELVAPKQNFEEVLGSVAATRAAAQYGGGLGGEDSDQVVALLGSINEQLKSAGGNNTINIQGDAIGDPAWVQALAKAISNGLEFSNIKIFGINAGKKLL